MHAKNRSIKWIINNPSGFESGQTGINNNP